MVLSFPNKLFGYLPIISTIPGYEDNHGKGITQCEATIQKTYPVVSPGADVVLAKEPLFRGPEPQRVDPHVPPRPLLVPALRGGVEEDELPPRGWGVKIEVGFCGYLRRIFWPELLRRSWACIEGMQKSQWDGATEFRP